MCFLALALFLGTAVGVDDTRTSGNKEHPTGSDDEASFMYKNRHGALNHIKYLCKTLVLHESQGKKTLYARMRCLW